MPCTGASRQRLEEKNWGTTFKKSVRGVNAHALDQAAFIGC